MLIVVRGHIIGLDERGSFLTPENIEACVKRIRNEEYERNCDKLVQTFLDLMTKLDIEKSDNRMSDEFVSINSNQRSTVVISRRDKKVKASFPVSNSQIDLSDIFLAVRIILLDIDLSYEEYCKRNGIDSDKSASKMEYRGRIKTVKSLNRMFNEKELSCLPTSSSASDEFDKEIVELESEFEYSKLHDFLDTVQYYGKLLSQYGYDSNRNEWNVKKFPITQHDKQMDGIKSDIEKSRNAVQEYYEYLEYLAEIYDVNFDEIDDYVLIYTSPDKRRT